MYRFPDEHLQRLENMQNAHFPDSFEYKCFQQMFDELAEFRLKEKNNKPKPGDILIMKDSIEEGYAHKFVGYGVNGNGDYVVYDEKEDSYLEYVKTDFIGKLTPL